MSQVVYFDKYDARGAYHWAECDRRFSNWKRYNPALDARYELTARKIRSLGQGDSLLDVGCGDGFLMGRVAATMKRVAGVDSEESAIRLAREKLRGFPNCEPIHTNCYDLPFEQKVFDVVTSADVIEHLKDPAHHLTEACRVLKVGGAFVLTTPKWRPDRKWDERHEKEYKPEELQLLLGKYFEHVELGYFWPTAWSQLYSTPIGWRLLKLLAVAGCNPFLQQGSKPEKFGQMLAVCRAPRESVGNHRDTV